MCASPGSYAPDSATVTPAAALGWFLFTVKAPARLRRGFSLIELLVVIAVMAVLLGLILVSTTRMRGRAREVECLTNLRHIGVAFQVYASDNAFRFPDPNAQQTNWESLIRGHLPSAAALRCPADEEVYPVLNSSYDWRDGGDLRYSAAGKPVESCRPDAVLAFDALPGWHRRNMINVVRIDNSVQSIEAQECFADLRRTVGAPPVTRQ